MAEERASALRWEVPTIRGSMDALYEAHAHECMRLAYLMAQGDKQLAEDFVQEAFARYIGRFRFQRDPERVAAYLKRTIVNLSKRHAYRQALERRYLASRPSRDEAEISIREKDDELWQALLRLPQRQRAAIFFRYVEDLSETQAADVLGCSVGAAKSLVSRGLTNLRHQLGGG